jgi:hypothetical protein
LYWGDVDDLTALRRYWQGLISSTCTSDTVSTLKADFIIASDVAGCPYVEAYASLIDTMVELSGPDTTILMSCQKRHSSENIFYEMFNEKFKVER